MAIKGYKKEKESNYQTGGAPPADKVTALLTYKDSG
jgi:hypothetical protein